jgi:hypothetical protein
MVQRRGNAEAPPHHALGSQIARCCGPNLLLTEHQDKKRKSRPRAPHTKSLTCTHANRSATIKAALAILFEAAPNQIRDAARWLVVPSWRTLTALCHLTHSVRHTRSIKLHHFHHYRRISLSFKCNIFCHKHTHRRSRPLIIIIPS